MDRTFTFMGEILITLAINAYMFWQAKNKFQDGESLEHFNLKILNIWQNVTDAKIWLHSLGNNWKGVSR